MKSVKHPDYIMAWDVFSGAEGAGRLYFLPKNVTMHASNYLEVLKEHMLPFFEKHEGVMFIHDSAICLA